mgnify:CR=1 FL=1
MVQKFFRNVKHLLEPLRNYLREKDGKAELDNFRGGDMICAHIVRPTNKKITGLCIKRTPKTVVLLTPNPSVELYFSTAMPDLKIKTVNKHKVRRAKYYNLLDKIGKIRFKVLREKSK